MKPIVITGVPRADPDAVEALGRYGVATIHEAMGRVGLLSSRLRPVWGGARAAGTAVTVLCLPGDNLTVHLAVEQTGPGDLLVITTTSPSGDGFVGELFTTALAARGVVGLVTTTGIRDVADISAARFPAWSNGISAQGTVKATAGEVNRPVVIGGTTIRPGDAVVADDDGAVCVPRTEIEDVLGACARRTAKEAAARSAYQDGGLSLDFNGLRALVAELGVEYRSWEDDRE